MGTDLDAARRDLRESFTGHRVPLLAAARDRVEALERLVDEQGYRAVNPRPPHW